MKKGIIIAAFFIMLIPLANAYTSSEIYINEDGSCVFIGTASKEIGIEGIELQNGKVVGITQSLTSKKGEIWTFSLSLNDSAEIIIILPEDSEIRSAVESNVETSIGAKSGAITIGLAGTNPSISFDYRIDMNRGNDYLLPVTLISLAIILAVVLLRRFFTNKRKEIKQPDASLDKKREKRIKIIKKVLNEREKMIVDALLKLGEAKQSLLQRKTGIPKASFSRHIQNLEKKGIIKKEGTGRNNILKVKKSFLN